VVGCKGNPPYEETIASERRPKTSVRPMGSLFEGRAVRAEVMILKLRDRLGVTPEAMRANHANLG
jgi:6-phospho-3-hexuloisomerase